MCLLLFPAISCCAAFASLVCQHVFASRHSALSSDSDFRLRRSPGAGRIYATVQEGRARRVAEHWDRPGSGRRPHRTMTRWQAERDVCRPLASRFDGQLDLLGAAFIEFDPRGGKLLSPCSQTGSCLGSPDHARCCVSRKRSISQAILDTGFRIGAYTGVDNCRAMIEFLQRNVRDRRMSYVLLDAQHQLYNEAGQPMDFTTRLPLEEEGYDVASMFSVITHQHPADSASIFTLLRRYVRPEGHQSGRELRVAGGQSCTGCEPAHRGFFRLSYGRYTILTAAVRTQFLGRRAV